MLRAAQIKDGVVVNVIVIDEENLAAFVAMGINLLDGAPFGLELGDYQMGEDWARMIDGVEVILPLAKELEPEEADVKDMLAALEYLGVEQEAAHG